MWKDSIRNIVVIFQPNILRIVGFYVRHSANILVDQNKNIFWKKNGQKLKNHATLIFGQNHWYEIGNLYLTYQNVLKSDPSGVGQFFEIGWKSV